jgi:Putative peptidoglycan binding domain
MTAVRMAAGRFVLSVSSAAFLVGCAVTPLGPTVQVMPGQGKSFETFQADNTSCRSFAAGQVSGQADAANQRAVGTALLGTALGAGIGAAGGSLGDDAGGGAAVGAAAGAAGGTAIGAGSSSNDQMNIQAQYDNAFAQCMFAKGEQVPGYVPVAAVPASSAPAPDPLVRATQSELIRLGFLKGSADGYIGPKTHAAIASFEQANGLQADGSASPRLLARLQATSTTAVATTSAPSGWVAPTGTPTGTPNVTPATASAAAPTTNWVTPTKSP